MEIGIWGDSITYGQCDSEGLGWVGRLLRSFSLTHRIEVYNRGVCGDTTKGLLRRFKTEAVSIKPSIIIFAIGINDAKYLPGKTVNNVLLEQFRKNMKLLVRQAKIFTDAIFIVSATKVDERTKRSSGNMFLNTEIQTYNTFLEELSETEKLKFINVFEVLDPNSDLFDGLHPNAAGYEKLFAVIAVGLLKTNKRVMWN